MEVLYSENANKALEECRESSQLKRRRMLQYDSNATDTSIGNEQFSYTVQSKVRDQHTLLFMTIGYIVISIIFYFMCIDVLFTHMHGN